MKYTMDGNDAAPIIITHRTVIKQPKVNIRKKFVGLTEGLKTLAAKAIDLIQESFWTEEREVIDPGQSKVVHYAIDVEDDGTDPENASLIATKINGSARPGYGMHFEVIKMLDNKPVEDGVIRAPVQEEDRVGKAKLVGERPKAQPHKKYIPNFGVDKEQTKGNE